MENKIKEEFHSSDHYLYLEDGESKYSIRVMIKSDGTRSLFTRKGDDKFKFFNSKPADIKAIAELLLYASEMKVKNA